MSVAPDAIGGTERSECIQNPDRGSTLMSNEPDDEVSTYAMASVDKCDATKMIRELKLVNKKENLEYEES
ncbi:MAG: hypothetical protein ABL876_06185 [Chitinophagaceae bacterium]